ncbi:MAG TPA: alpha/beta hydrolase [Polyangiaceae bacterium]|jgi:pimeloyl-ACP methyl ester carboxylesterase
MTFFSRPLRLGRRLLGRSRPRFPYLTGKFDLDVYRERASLPGWSGTELTIQPTFHLKGLLRRPSGPAPWLLYFPGNDPDQLGQGQAFLSHFLDRDWGLAAYACRGFDVSERPPSLAELTADAPQVLSELCKSQRISPRAIHVVGFSLGGYLACVAASTASRENRGPATLSLLAPVHEAVMLRRSLWQKLDRGDPCDSRPFLARISAPVLLVQGTADEAFGGPAQGRAMARALGARASYLELSGVGHNELLSHERALSALRDFVSGHSADASALPGPVPRASHVSEHR